MIRWIFAALILVSFAMDASENARDQRISAEVNAFISGIIEASSETDISKKANHVRDYIARHPHVLIRLMQGESLLHLLELSAIGNFSPELTNTLNRNLKEPLSQITESLRQVIPAEPNSMIESVLKVKEVGPSRASLLRQMMFLDTIPEALLACLADLFAESLMETKFSESTVIKVLFDPKDGVNISQLPEKLGLFFGVVLEKYFDNLHIDDRRDLILTCLRLPPHADTIELISALLNSSGPVLQKTFQLISQEMESPFLSKVMIRLKNDIQGFSTAEALKKVEEALGQPADEVFEYFRDTPVGSATIGQVHLARLRGSHKEVIVKVKRPGIVKKAQREFATLRSLTKDSSILDFLSNLEESLQEEMDFHQEVEHLKRGSIYNGADQGRIHAVKVLDELQSTSEVIFMERAQGKSLHKLKSYAAPTLKHRALVGLLKIWFHEALFGSGFFHGDLHSGNIFLSETRLNSHGDRDYALTLIDFGNVGKFSKPERKALVKMMLAETYNNSDLMFLAFDSILELSVEQRELLIQNINTILASKTEYVIEAIIDKLLELKVSIPKNIILFNRGRSFLEQQLEEANLENKALDPTFQTTNPKSIYASIVAKSLLWDVVQNLGEAKKDNDTFVDNAVLSCLGTSLFWGAFVHNSQGQSH